jgi:hypothetical protein
MRFFLFILANALLFIRPSELVPDLAAVEIYRWFILACLAVSLPDVLKQATARFPAVPPIVSCVVLLLPAVFLSGFFHGNFELIQDTVTEYVKVLIYFLLLIALVTDLARLRHFLRWIGLFSAAVTLIAVLRYHADAGAPTPPPPPPTKDKDGASKKANDAVHGTFVVDDVRDPNTGEITKVNRMCGTGIFNDPNDFALILVTAIPLGLYWLTDRASPMTRPVWLVLLALFGYALLLTASRGGFLALMAGLMTLFYLKLGGKKTFLLSLFVLPILLGMFAGRMTTISADEGTGQTRIQLWRDGLFYFQQSPLFGIGMENYQMFSSHVAHNSFIHCFTELGVIGGTLFLGAFYFALKGMFDLRNRTDELEPELRRLYPFLSAAVVAYTIGICFLSRSYIVPTYMILGLAGVYMRLHAGQVRVPLPAWTFGTWPRLAGLSCGFLLASMLFVRMFARG